MYILQQILTHVNSYINNLYPLPAGIYEVRDVLQELQIKRIGNSAMDPNRLQALDLMDIFLERDTAMMTQEELDAIAQYPLYSANI